MPPGNGTLQHSLALESHEDRLQRVETALQTVAVSLGKLEYIVEQVDSNTKLVLEKFESVEDRLSPLEEFDKSQKDTRKSVKGFIKAMLIAGGGAFAAGFGAWLWSVMSGM